LCPVARLPEIEGGRRGGMATYLPHRGSASTRRSQWSEDLIGTGVSAEHHLSSLQEDLQEEVDSDDTGEIDQDTDDYLRAKPYRPPWSAAPGDSKAKTEGVILPPPPVAPQNPVAYEHSFRQEFFGDVMHHASAASYQVTDRGSAVTHHASASSYFVGGHVDHISTGASAGDDPRCESLVRLAPSGRPQAITEEDLKGEKYDIFLSHLQRNAQDTIISLQMFLKEIRPGLKFFIDVDVEMSDGLHETLRKGVLNCRAFLFFITDGILTSMWCAQELRWAVEYGKNIVLVRETDARHGGIEMKDFFEQVPEDLMPVFKNNIAIPWYREKGFRGVSVHTILKRCALQDEHADELAKLQATKKQLTAVVRHSRSSATAFDVLQQHSFTLKLVIFLGGFGTFKSKWAQRAYDIIFNISFWSCGALCALNLVYKEKPYHNFPTDALTAYVHFPAWQSWLVWHRFVKTNGCDELLSKAQSNKERQGKLNLLLQVGGWLVLLVQCAMVTDVLMGFSLPRTLDLAGEHEAHEFKNFMSMHAMAMWLVIPPVISAMFSSYVMFGFIACLHLLDILATKDLLAKCIEPLAGYYEDPQKADAVSEKPKKRGSRKLEHQHMTPRTREKETTSSVADSSEFGGSVINDVVDNIQEFQKQAALEDSLFRTVAELLVFLIDGVQSRIDHTSNAVGGLWVHLVFFSVAQVLAISSSLVALGAGHTNSDYMWWWGLQDFFHLGGGIVLLLVAMGVFCVVTATFSRVPRFVFKMLAGAGVPVSRQASVVSLLGTRPLGMHVAFGFILVDMPKACGFFFVITVLMMDKVMYVLSILTQYDVPT